MASFFRRRRSLIAKVVLTIPALWFLGVVLMNYNDVDSNGSQGNVHKRQAAVDHRAIPAHEFGGDNGHNDRLHAVDRGVLAQKIHEELGGNNQGNNQGNSFMKEENEENIRTPKPNKVKRVEEKPLKYIPKEQNRQEVDPNAPGENGKAVVIDKEKLSPAERKKYDDGWQNNAFNMYASDMISLHRSLPDVRDSECKSLQYQEKLPDTSVVVCFHNEAWTVLLRTVHSIIDRSPPHLLREVVLVDDFSDMDHLKEPLETYMAKLGKVKVVRTKKREGLIRARLLGYSASSGDVLTYLDSHCECTEGWLEPLLDRIATNNSIVVCPVIDVIEDDSFKYQYGSAKSTSIGGFDWNLQFNWHAIPEYERQRRQNKDYLPVRSPTMAGGLFSISREYFTKIGTYDPGMDIWGGENLEMSFRVWMCGGTLEIIPCSHVGHIFRKRSPYKWRSGVNVVKKNSIRLAEVWMDDYKNYYYERFNNDLGEYGDVSERKALRKKLNCKPFDWFVKNIYPDLFVPGEAVASGEIRNKAKPMCVDSSVDSHNFHKPVNMWPCHNQGGNQYWMLSKGGEIRRDDGCLDFSGGESVIIYPCHSQKGNQEWVYREDNTILHANTQKCMEVSVDGQKLLMRTCTGIDRQLWQWKKKPPNGIIRDEA